MKEYRITEESLQKAKQMLYKEYERGVVGGGKWIPAGFLCGVLDALYVPVPQEEGEEPTKMTCPNCEGKGTVWGLSPLSKKPLTAGTRLISPDGEEVMVIADPTDGDLSLANLTTGKWVRVDDGRWWWKVGGNTLQSVLTAAGYRMKDDA